MSAKSVERRVLAYDLGGTKVAVGVVDSRGRILEEIREPVKLSQGKKAVLRQLIDIGGALLARHRGIRRVGVASAGPLHPKRGTLLDPTNFAKGPDGAWGEVPLAQILSKAFRRPVLLENDAAAAILAEHWMGAARGIDDAMILTLGTGLGTGIIANGELVRAGRGLHTEAGHMIIRAGDADARCGCGNFGCAEAYLSGNGFARWVHASKKMGPRAPLLDGRALAGLAREGDRRARKAFDEYADLMAVAIHNYAVLFCPERVVLTGSFAAAADLFVPRTRKLLLKMLARRRRGIDLLPEIRISELENEAGLLGGAWVALNGK